MSSAVGGMRGDGVRVNTRLRGVEAARGVAAVLVVLVHATDMLADPKYFGRLAFDGLFVFAHAGVDFFFVLSGFIIAYAHLGRAPAGLSNAATVADYLRSRAIRIYPTYWAVCLLYAVVLAASPTRGRYEQGLYAVLSSLALLPQPHEPILGVAWSLQYELVFYALFAVFLVARRLGVALFVLWLGLTLLAVETDVLDGLPGRFLFRVFNGEFVCGMGVAWLVLHRRLPALSSWVPGACLAAGVALFFGAGLRESWGTPLPAEYPPLHALYAAGAALALYGLVGLERQPAWRVPEWAVAVGGASYSLYLLHVVVLMFLQQALLRTGALMALPLEPVFLACVAVAVGVALVFARTVERPLLRWCRARIPRGGGFAKPAATPL